ncbi:hypothetical protein [Nonomuraea sp. NPDC049784]|uniref:hypothetical protein n=1 Tax=Nonomuraea sp. NPDC049784 TaxID=3154361 RepID=UPI003404EE3C
MLPEGGEVTHRELKPLAAYLVTGHLREQGTPETGTGRVEQLVDPRLQQVEAEAHEPGPLLVGACGQLLTQRGDLVAQPGPPGLRARLHRGVERQHTDLVAEGRQLA